MRRIVAGFILAITLMPVVRAAAQPAPAIGSAEGLSARFFSGWAGIALPGHLEHRRAQFAALDFDGDGAVTPADLEHHRIYLAANRRAMIISTIIPADLDGDGIVTREEVMRYVGGQWLSPGQSAEADAARRPQTEAEIARHMRPDLNGDGRIDGGEMLIFAKEQLARETLSLDPTIAAVACTRPGRRWAHDAGGISGGRRAPLPQVRRRRRRHDFPGGDRCLSQAVRNSTIGEDTSCRQPPDAKGNPCARRYDTFRAARPKGCRTRETLQWIRGGTFRFQSSDVGSRASAIPTRRCRCSIRASRNTACRSRASSGSRPAFRWCEGPVYFGDGRCLLWSDIPNNRIMRWDEETGHVSVFRRPSNNANGNTRDRQGRLVTCEHDSRRVTRTEYDGAITVLIDKFDGKPLNSPNDVVVKSDELDLVHRSAVRHPRQLRGARGHARTAHECLPARSEERAGDGRGGRHQAARTASRSRPTKRRCTSSRRVRHRARSTLMTWSTTAPGSPTAGCSSPPRRAARPTAFASMSTAICGAAGAWAMRSRTASRSSIPRASRSASSPCRSARPMSVSADRKRNRLFMAASHSIYSLYVNTQGAAGG